MYMAVVDIDNYYLFNFNFEVVFKEMMKLLYLFVKNGCFLSALFGILGVGLIVVGFFVPPTAIIDGSVLQGSGIILGFTALFKLEKIIESIAEGRKVTFKHGATEVTVDDKNKEDEK